MQLILLILCHGKEWSKVMWIRMCYISDPDQAPVLGSIIWIQSKRPAKKMRIREIGKNDVGFKSFETFSTPKTNHCWAVPVIFILDDFFSSFSP